VSPLPARKRAVLQPAAARIVKWKKILPRLWITAPELGKISTSPARSNAR
jgi:hypothetical protein